MSQWNEAQNDLVLDLMHRHKDLFPFSGFIQRKLFITNARIRTLERPPTTGTSSTLPTPATRPEPLKTTTNAESTTSSMGSASFDKNSGAVLIL